MNHTGQSPSSPTAVNAKTVTTLQRRLGAVVSFALLAAAAGGLYLSWPARRSAGLLFAAAMLFLAIVVVWATGRVIKKSLESGLSAPTAGPSPDGRHRYDAEAGLADLRARFGELAQAHFEAIAVHQKIRIVSAGQTMAALFGYTLPEVMDLTILDLFAPESQSTVLRNILMKYNRPYKAIGQKKDGVTFPAEILSREVSTGSQTVSVMGVRELAGEAQEDVRVEIDKTREELAAEIQASSQELRQANDRLARELAERKKTEAELIERNRELTSLQTAAVAITSSLDLRYVLDTVAYEMAKLLSVESCAIHEWNPQKNTISRMAKYSAAGRWDAKSMGEVRDLADFPLTSGVLDDQIPEQMTIGQPGIDPFEGAYMRRENIKTRMLLPMVFQRSVVGLVELEDSRVERVFTHQEISLAKLLANQAASAIENARLFQQARQEIAERQRAEAELRQERALLAQRVEERTAELSKANAELARASRLKDEFLAGMSHELRTPLNAILGSAEILQTGVFGELSEKQLKYSKNIEESGRHLLALINDILDLSKIEAGKVELDIAPVAVDSVCQASLRIIKQLAHKKQLALSYTGDESITTLPADERRLKQILVNLLSNAIKFTPEGGRIGLEVKADAEQEVVHFTVWDTGIGISREDMGRLFQPFVQLDSRLSRQYAGTGLGLSLVSRMAELHGGGVSVESQVGRGSRFTVSLPWPGSAPDSTEGAARPELPALAGEVAITGQKPAPAQPLILLADDNEDNINTVTDFLQAQGYRLVIARNGKEAIERAKEVNPHIILMDVQMPEMDGLEATRRLRRTPQLAGIPVIAITALAMPGDRERCLAAGANEYLSKPVSLRGLVRMIETFLNRSRIPAGGIP